MRKAKFAKNVYDTARSIGAKVAKATGYDSNWNSPSKYRQKSRGDAPRFSPFSQAGKMVRRSRPQSAGGRKGPRKARGKFKRVPRTLSGALAQSRKRAVREVFDIIAPRNEYITQAVGQVRTSGVGITGQGNQSITVLATPVSPTDILSIMATMFTQQGASGGAGTQGFMSTAYDNILLDNIGGKRTHHMYEFVNPGNQDVHFRVWWFKAKQDIWENNQFSTLATFISYATSTTVATATNRGAISYTGTYTNVTNPYNIVGWHPNLVRNQMFRHFFNIKIGKESIIRPGGHHRLRVPLGKGARSVNISTYALRNDLTAAQGRLMYRRGDIIPVVVTYGDVVHGTTASANMGTVSTGSVTLDYIRIGHHFWQGKPSVVPQLYFGGAGLNQTATIGAGVTLADASGAPAAYNADA